MSLFRKKPASQADRLAAFRLDSIPSREFTSELGDLLAELDLEVQREKSAFIATVGGRLLFLFWNDDDKVLSGWNGLAIRGLKAYGWQGLDEEFAASIERARRWLRTARPQRNEEASFQLLGLHWAGEPAGAMTALI